MSVSSASAAAIVFEPEFLAGLTTIFEEKIVFNQLLGLKVTSIAPQQVVARIDMRPELVGHYAYNRIHGGVISAGLDAMGGLAVMAEEGASFGRMLREPAAREAFGAFMEKRHPDFSKV